MLGNLIANAVKFTRPRDTARIDIDTLPGQGTETVIFVRDNGVGFDPAYGDKLFGVFQRLHRVDEFEGTGIGLATVRRIIARHGGQTWAEGRLARGRLFIFRCPNRFKPIEDQMKINALKTIRLKIALWTGICLMVSGIVIVAYAVVIARSSAIQAANERALSEARTQAGIVKGEIEISLDATRTLARHSWR